MRISTKTITRSVVSVAVFLATAALAPNAHASQPKAATRAVSQLPAGTDFEAMTVVGFDPAVAASHGYSLRTLSDGTVASVKKSALRALGQNPSDLAIRKAASSTFNPSTRVAGGKTLASWVTAHSSSTAKSLQSGSSSTRPLLAPKALAASVRPDNYVYGNCGDSYYFLGVSAKTWSSITGYDVRAAVSHYSWFTQLDSPNGSQWEVKEYEGSSGVSWEGHDNYPPYLTHGTHQSDPIWHGTWRGLVSYGEATLVDGTTCVSGDPHDAANN